MSTKHYSNVSRVLFGFTYKKNIKQAVVIGLMASVIISASAVGFANAYPTEASRALIAATFSTNTGLIAMLGKPSAIDTIAGFTAWRSLGAFTLIVDIWAIFLSTRLFRGDEEQGRLELVLTGKTSLANATLQVTLAVIALLGTVMIIISIPVGITNQINNFGWQPMAIVFLAFVIILTAVLFASIGALCSQIVATRAAALKVAAAVFGVSFMLRALGDISSGFEWLSVISPLGWLERLRPLSNTDVFWLLPIVTTIILCFGTAILLANLRDYGASLLPDKDSALPRYRWLNSGGGLLFRLHKTNALLWVFGLFIANFMFGTFLSAATEALKESNTMQESLSKVANGPVMDPTKLFMGVILLMMILMLLIMVAGQINSLRETEANGYLDNLLVRQSTRLGLALSKTGLIVGSITISAVAISLGMYLGAKSQDVYISATDMITAGVNIIAVPIVFLGVGILFFGFVPRLMSVLLYTLIVWAFVVEIVGSVINLNHWILDTSLLHHIALAPAVDVRWSVFWVYLGLGLVMSALGTWRFTRRDIELM